MPQALIDIGPAADQLNIPGAGTPINNIQLTHIGKPGPVLLIAKLAFSGATPGELLQIAIARAGIFIPASVALFEVPPAISNATIYSATIIPDSQPGATYQLYAYSSSNNADVLANQASIIMLGVPAQHSLAPQGVPTP